MSDVLDYDKLQGLKGEESLFDFKCQYCKSGNVHLEAMDVVFRAAVENNDIKNNKIREYLDSLPTIQESLIIAANRDKGNVMCFCKSCKQYSRVLHKINIQDLRKWIRNNLGKSPIFL